MYVMYDILGYLFKSFFLSLILTVVIYLRKHSYTQIMLTQYAMPLAFIQFFAFVLLALWELRFSLVRLLFTDVRLNRIYCWQLSYTNFTIESFTILFLMEEKPLSI